MMPAQHSGSATVQWHQSIQWRQSSGSAVFRLPTFAFPGSGGLLSEAARTLAVPSRLTGALAIMAGAGACAITEYGFHVAKDLTQSLNTHGWSNTTATNILRTLPSLAARRCQHVLSKQAANLACRTLKGSLIGS